MEEINMSIAKNLRALRKDKELTLEDLSLLTDVSRSMLGEIERGSTNPTILVLWKIANGLKTPLTALIQEEKSDYHIVRNSDLTVINHTENYQISTIFPYYDEHKSEMLKLELNPHSHLANSGHMKGVDEYLYVSKGTLKLIINKETLYLDEGDSVRFNGESHHELHNNTNAPLLLINILHYGNK